MTRIERAARVYVNDILGIDLEGLVDSDIVLRAMGKALTAAYPGLMSEPPTHWVAPMEPTEEMLKAQRDAPMTGRWGDNFEMDMMRFWQAARVAYLKKSESP